MHGLYSVIISDGSGKKHKDLFSADIPENGTLELRCERGTLVISKSDGVEVLALSLECTPDNIPC